MERALRLKPEVLSELTDGDLAYVRGGGGGIDQPCIPLLSCPILRCLVPEPQVTPTCPSATGC